MWLWSLPVEDASALASISLAAIAVTLTAIGVFDNIAKHAGAGTLVPITGFSNAVASPAIDAKSEGFVLGVGAKIFTVAGPVLLYGTLAGVLYGLIYYAYICLT
jgi:stage V sporulation protein AC